MGFLLTSFSLMSCSLFENDNAEKTIEKEPAPITYETVSLYADDLQNRRFDAFFPQDPSDLVIENDGNGNYFAEIIGTSTLTHHGAAFSARTWRDYDVNLQFRKTANSTYSFGFRITAIPSPTVGNAMENPKGYWLENQGNTWTLKKDGSNETLTLFSSNAETPADTWHSLNISVRNDKDNASITHIRASINGKEFIEFADNDPVAMGGLAFDVPESTARLQLDNVKVTGYVGFASTWAKTAGPPGGSIADIAIHPQEWATAYVGTYDGGVFITTDGGERWREVGLQNGLWKIRIRNIEIAPSDPKVIYVGTAGKHVSSLWRSDDNGYHWRWTSAGDVLNLDPNAGETYAIATHPSDPMRVYFGVDKRGVYVSDNGGETFTHLGDSSGLIGAIAINPDNPDTMLAGTSAQLGIFLAQPDLEAQPNGTSIFRTDNGGTTWTASDTGIHGESIVQILYDPNNSSRVFAITKVDVRTGDLYRSDNGGQSWSKLDLTDTNTGLPLSVAAVKFASQSTPTLVAFTTTKVISSIDGGGTWTELSDRGVLAADVGSNNPDVIYTAMNSGEVSVSEDFGTTWRESNEGMVAQAGMALAVDPQLPHVVYMGSAFGIYRSTDYGDAWTKTYSGDFIAIAVDPTNSNTVYAGLRTLDNPFLSDTTGGSTTTANANQAWIIKSTDQGLNWNDISKSTDNNNDDFDVPVAAIAVDPQNPLTIYAGTGGGPQGAFGGKGLYKSVDGGMNWSKTSIPDVAVPVVVVNPADSQQVVVATLGEGVYVSNDGGTNFNQRNNGFIAGEDPTVLNIYALAMNPGNPNIMYAAYNSQYAPGSGEPSAIYKTVDGGLNWAVVLGDDDLPPTDEHQSLHMGGGVDTVIVIDPVQPERVIVGLHDPGIILTEDGGNSWRFAQEGFVPLLTHVYPYRMTVSNNGEVAYSTSCGRGVFRNFLKKAE